MTIQALEAQLKKIERQRALLSKRLAARKARQFTTLPTKVGLRSVDALILSLSPYASPKLRGSLMGNGAQPIRKQASAKRVARRGRPARYGEEVRASVRKLLEQGQMTSAAIGKKFGVSPYTIKDWKKQWGLSKKRRRAAAKKK
jgi:Helix-turn-helix domain of resolvase